ncbi:ABC transporter ATP-binding protein [Actinophytocola sp.]|uniref:ABC transporter ATP-binding protein n=1 Tax=Actinophytocola sp. TaxID=1872138 RepID=UPI003D6AD82C
MTATPAVSVRDLGVEFRNTKLVGRGSKIAAVDGVTFDVMPGETLALVGESGSGKSTTARAILGLLPRTSGEVEVLGHPVPSTGRVPRSVRRHMQIVFQDPYSSLDPSMRVLDIVAEPLDAHAKLSRQERRERVEEALRQVSLDPGYAPRYPDQFSGGQRQRIAIARAIVSRPALVVCDEAVSALDVSTQGQILNLLKRLQGELGLSYLFISHDLGVVRSISHRTAVMYLGQIVEVGPTARVWREPAHPYTAALLSAIPRPRAEGGLPRLVLGGDTPSPANPPPACRFHTRCPLVMDVCRAEVPPPFPVPGGGSSTCHLHDTDELPSSGSVLPLVDKVAATAMVDEP